LYVDRDLAQVLGIIIDEHDKLPDVMVWSHKRNALFVVESVTSVGPVEEQRRNEINHVINEKPKKISPLKARKKIRIGFVSAFPNRSTFARFSKLIAWGTDVWIASEPEGIIRYQHSGKTIYIKIRNAKFFQDAGAPVTTKSTRGKVSDLKASDNR
jgi:hypothetical protein